ncbi:MAG: FAD-dependent oxidoreductase [Acutalibacteraceae bacterium]
MKSIWNETANFKKRPKLETDIYTPALIIGAGITGILTSYFLSLKGIKNVIIDKGQICSGQTENTTAKITAQHADVYHKIINSYGEKTAKLYYEYNQDAINCFEEIIKKENIDCDFERLPSYIYSVKDKKSIETERDAYKILGIRHTYTNETELEFNVAAALKMENQAQFSPLKFLEKLSEKMTIYENTPAVKVENNTVSTDCARISAENIIFACAFPFVNFPGLYFARMHRERSYVIALQNAQKLGSIYYGTDTDSLSLRNFGDVLLLGGKAHRSGKNEEGGRYQSLKQTASGLWKDSSCVAAWSAQDCMTGDKMPYIGRFSKKDKTHFVATGYNKWGMTSSMTAAKIIAESIESGKDKSSIFSPQRKVSASVAGEICKDTAEAVSGITSQLFAFTGANPALLKENTADVCNVSGKKQGIYKDENSNLTKVNSRCPHLGCELHFNKDDKTWECPCHGSCFSLEGKLLDGPAQKDIKTD